MKLLLAIICLVSSTTKATTEWVAQTKCLRNGVTDGTIAPNFASAGLGATKEECWDKCTDSSRAADVVTAETWDTAQAACCSARCSEHGCICDIVYNGVSFHPDWPSPQAVTVYSTPTQVEDADSWSRMKPNSGRDGQECTATDGYDTVDALKETRMMQLHKWLQEDRKWLWKNPERKTLKRNLGNLAYNRGSNNPFKDDAEQWFEDAFMDPESSDEFTEDKWNALKSSVATFMETNCDVGAFPARMTSLWANDGDASLLVEWMTAKFGCVNPLPDGCD